MDYLRDQLQAAQDRLLAVANPQALAQVKGTPMAAQPSAIESYVDDQGQAWVTVAGKEVKLEKYTELMKDAGVRLPTGAVIPEEENRMAFAMLDKLMQGGPL